MIWKTPSGLSINIVTWLVVSVVPICSLQVSQPSECLLCEPGNLGWLGSRDLANVFFVKVCMCSYEKPGWPGYRNIYKEKSGEARSRKPSHCGWPGSCEEVPKTTREVKSSQAPPPIRSMGRGVQIISLLHTPIFSLVPIPRALYIPTKGSQDNPGQKNWFNKYLLNTIYYGYCTFWRNSDDP